MQQTLAGTYTHKVSTTPWFACHSLAVRTTQRGLGASSKRTPTKSKTHKKQKNKKNCFPFFIQAMAQNGACGACLIGVAVSVLFIVVCGIGAQERATYVAPTWFDSDIQNCECQRFERDQTDSQSVRYSPVCDVRVQVRELSCTVTGDSYASADACQPGLPQGSTLRVRFGHKTGVCYTGSPTFRISEPWFIASCVLGPGLWPMVGLISIFVELGLQATNKLKKRKQVRNEKACERSEEARVRI